MAEADPQKFLKGYGSDERPLAQVLWAREKFDPDHPVLKDASDFEPEKRKVDYSIYYDPDFAAAEQQAIWRKSWLYACREEDLPNIGDRTPYQVGKDSYFIVRTGEDEFKAFFNSCLHRGTMLCAKQEAGDTIRCPYHGWEWNIDGRLKRIPSHWDFADLNRNNASLPEVKLDRWGGFIFINADPDCAPLDEALSVLKSHFEKFEFKRRYTAGRFRKQVKANWKVTQEAFQEAYHLYATHPEAVPFTGDAQAQYDVWPGENGHVGRNVTPSAQPSMHAPADASAVEAAQMFAQAMVDWHYPGHEYPEFDPDKDLRLQAAEWHRKTIKEFYGRDSKIPDAAMLDSFLYFMFPHAAFWMTEAVPMTYQFTPHPTDPEQAFFEVRLMLPCPEGRETPPPAELVELGPDDSVFENVPPFGFLGFIFDQDMSNMPLIQKGAHAANPEESFTRLGRYQEQLIQHWNNLIVDRVAELDG